MQAAIGSLSNISIASLKNSLDEVRAQVYPRNETEKKVIGTEFERIALHI